MKNRLVLTFCIVAATSLPAISQTQSGSWELSLAGNVGSMSATTEFTGGGRTQTDEGEAQAYLGLNLRAGYYIVDGFSLEPELYLLAVEKTPPAFNFGANASYTFTIPESPVKPFLIAGYGIGNGIPIMQRLIGRSSGDFDIPVARLGAGVKFLVTKQVALKLEYRYERYSYEISQTVPSYFGYAPTSYTMNEVWNYHNVMIGISVFFPGGGAE